MNYEEFIIQPAWLLERLSSWAMAEATRITCKYTGIADDQSESLTQNVSQEQHAKWQDFISIAEQHDELWYFATPPETWHKLSGQAGFVILREGQQVATWITLRS